ncbi:helix-turn-helix domain-containing protein [Salmonella enterica]
MGYRKENKFAFDEVRKESFIQRLKEVIGGRSIRAAAKDWGLSFSTLNNYITRGTEPSFIAMQAIAHAEGISLDWLAFGMRDSYKNQETQYVPMQSIESAGVDDNEFVNELLRRATPADKEKLVNAICDIGIKGILSKLQQPETQHSQPEREYTREEQEAMLRALPISERVKNTASLALALGDDAHKEILEILEDVKRRYPPEGSAASPPDSSLKQKAG